MLNINFFLQVLFQVDHIILSTHKFTRLHNCIVFACIKVSSRSIFNVFQHKSDRKVDFG